jgi:hypothetical protein
MYNDNDDDKYCRFMFTRVMEYLNKKQVKEAGISFASDCNKKGIQLGFIGMMLFNQKDENELLRIICGFHFMPTDLKQYYHNPQKAFEDYK